MQITSAPEELATTINDCYRLANESAGSAKKKSYEAVYHAIEAGRHLFIAKEQVGAGSFMTYVANLLDMQPGAAARYMAVSQKYPEIKSPEDVKALGLNSVTAALRKAELVENTRKAPTLRKGDCALDSWDQPLTKFLHGFRKDFANVDDWNPAKAEDVVESLRPVKNYMRMIAEKFNLKG